jgi:hypothetical protein
MLRVDSEHRVIKAMLETPQALEELGRLRNRHVAKLLSFLGGDQAPYVEAAIKRAFSMFAEDIETNIVRGGGHGQHSENSEEEND